MDAQIKGSTMPVLEMILDAGESVISTHGELSWMSSNVQLTQTTNTGGAKGVMSGLKRMIGGGGLFLTKYESMGGPGMISFAAKLPGRIFPVDITQGQGYLVHRHGWVCGTDGILPSMGLQQTFRGGLYGKEGFILQRLEGNGRAWIELSGEITTYELAAGQTLLVHPGHVGLFEERVTFAVQRLRGISNMAFGGDGYHLVTLTGPGNIWLQSLTIPGLAAAVAPYLPDEDHHDAAAAGVGGVLGGVIGKNL
jgi:uncharacterized protein (TIGR00266 family)